MKPRLSTKRNAAMTLFEVGIIVAVVLVLMVIFLPQAANRHSPDIICVNNLKQAGLAFKIWEGDNNDTLPMGISVTNGGTMELAATGDVVSTFLVMSNELSTPRILTCPADTRHAAMNFSGFTHFNLSYLVGMNATNDENPQLILTGDSNLELGGKPVKSGLQQFWTNDPVSWSAARHMRRGNIGQMDGSVQTTSSNRLHNFFVETGQVTNRFAVP